MSGTADQFTADFFNNVAAVSIVLLFAKIVSHRTRREPARSNTAIKMLHAVCIVAAAVGLVVGLVATDIKSDSLALRVLAWVALAVAGLVLIVDLLAEDLPHR